ncbi:hypothetical protein ACFFRR_007719 [Megaselia abdita]
MNTQTDHTLSGAPNGGWGWVIVAAVALINMFNASITSVFGLLFGEQLEIISHGTSTPALLANLNSLALNFSGLFIGPAIKSFAPRKVTSFGIILISLGLALCGFATEVWQFALGYGLMVGIGLGLISPSTFMIINSYFTTKKARAVGITLAGTGIGQIIIPHIVRVLLENYGYQHAVFGVSLLSLVGLFGASFFSPLKSSPITSNPNDNKEVKTLLTAPIEEPNKTVLSQRPQTKQENSTFWGKVFNYVIKAMDLELLKDYAFWSIIVGMGLVYTATINFSMLFPYFLQNSVHLNKSDTALCMSMVASADLISRLLLPFATEKLQVPSRVVFLFGTIGLLISRAALAETTDITSLLVLSALTGITKSATVLNNNLAISEYVRPEKLAGGLGLNMITKAILVISVGSFLGWIRDFTESYILCLHVQNIFLGLVIVVWTPEILNKMWRRNGKGVLDSAV